jgi:hypothetical protein
VDLHSLVDPACGVLATRSVSADSVSDRVAFASALPTHRHHSRCGLQVLALDFAASGEGVERAHARITPTN